jgi:CHAT domain-containing protein
MLKTKERYLGKTHKSLYTILLYLGNLQVVIGNYSEADNYFERASNIAKTTFGAQSIPFATCLLYYKDLYGAIGDYEKTESSIKESLAIYIKSYGENNIKSGVLMHELALANFEADLYSGRKVKNKTNDIEQLFLKSLQIIKTTIGEKSVFYAEALENFAVFYAQTGQSTKALNNINTARSIWDAKIGGTNENSARLNLLSGKIHYLSGNYIQALSSFEKTRDEYEKIFDDRHPSYVEALGRCAQIYYISGNTEKAITSIEECTNKSMQYIDQVFPFLSERGKVAYWDKIKNDFEFYKTIAFSHSAAYPAMIGKIFNIQLQTKSLLLNSLLKIKNRIYASGDTASIRLYQEWQHTRDDLSIAYSMTNAQRKENQVNLSSLELTLEQIEKKLSEISADFATGTKTNSKTSHTWKNVQKTLGEKEMLIEVIPFRHFTKTFSDSIWYAFVSVTSKSNTPAFVVLKNGQDLEKKYLKYYRSSRMFNIVDEFSYDTYWKPLAPLIDEAHTTIYFSGDGVYNQINPETFIDKKGSYLINQKNIVCIGTGRDLINRAAASVVKQKNMPASTIAMVGNPTYYAGEAEGSIAQLPGSEVEVKKIDALLKEKGWLASLYIGKDATEETIKSIQSPKVYHISTHGFFWKDDSGTQEDELNEGNVSNPLLKSGLLLYNGGTLLQSSNINTINQADGILTAYEAMNLSLDNTELVVLSACETGLGEVKIGEGVYGLQRAFTVAGAHCIIMSLSKVSDEVTINLMSNFYTFWLKTGNKREAFMLAKQELIKSYPNPKYWGAFVMIGID